MEYLLGFKIDFPMPAVSYGLLLAAQVQLLSSVHHCAPPALAPLLVGFLLPLALFHLLQSVLGLMDQEEQHLHSAMPFPLAGLLYHCWQFGFIIEFSHKLDN